MSPLLTLLLQPSLKLSYDLVCSHNLQFCKLIAKMQPLQSVEVV